MRKTTIKDVAREAGVSITLVSKVLNAERMPDGKLSCSVSEQTAQRIFDTVERLGYRPNKAAASLRKGRENRIGFIIPDISNHFFADVARIVENEAHSAGYTVLFGSSDEKPEKLGQLVDTFISDGIDGLMITPCCDCEKHIGKAVARGIPVVLVIRDLPCLEKVGRVLPDSVKAIRMAMDHFYAEGCRKIEMVATTLRLSNVTDREALYSEYMASKGLDAYIRINHVDESDKENGIRYVAEDTFRRGVEALLFPSASLPLLCLRACKSLGIEVPSGMSILGFDGGDDYQLTTPDISQIMYSRQDTAATAFKMLEGMMTGKGEAFTVMLEPELVVGGSTLKSRTALTKEEIDRAGLRKKLNEALEMLNRY